MRLIEEMTNSRIVAGARGTIGLIDVSSILCCYPNRSYCICYRYR